ncbi:ribonuclease H1 isoform X1 [Perca flavescens]|uniref:ribonuclease H1 isoform X1 n=2 Tax=Perca flavescens TaxID=8167 RepID=UPI00106DDC37|nr:ribonuclease H1 isoform X1 [Perca flavescens]
MLRPGACQHYFLLSWSFLCCCTFKNFQTFKSEDFEDYSRVTLRRTVCSAADDMAKGKFFYAVKKGFKPGVYSSWDECKSQVDKFPAASFKKFASEKDAWAFFRGVEPSAVPEVNKAAQCVESAVALLPKRGPEPLEYIPLGKKRCHSDEDLASPPKRVKQSESSSSKSTDGFTYMGDAVVVYTDGCCSNNGQKGARAGIGVYWGHNHPLNVAERLHGRQTNQRAEIQAACRALELAKENDIKKLVLYTDSKFTINGVTSWVKNWKLNGWRLKSGGEITNKDDFVKLDQLNAEVEVVWMHIPGHAGYRGNEEADRLSREGAVKAL